VPSSPVDVLEGHREDVYLPCHPAEMLALAAVLDTVPDPRNPRGRHYRLGPLLTLSLLAVLSGATSLAKITRFIIGCDPQVRVRLGLSGMVNEEESA
jgi:hypothetical protein